jgi:nicotinamidase/pyrazinamidase
MKVLVIVDLQNDFLPNGALPVKDGDQVISVINALQKKCDLILATKDWHPPNHKSFANVHKKKVGETIELNGILQILWPIHCVQESVGAEFPKQLDRDKIEKVFFKGVDVEIDSYSAFFDNAHLRSTGLYEYLQARNIFEIYIVGLATDYCVKYSVLDALNLGLKVNVILDGCRGINLKQDDNEQAIAEMQKAGAHIMMSHEV